MQEIETPIQIFDCIEESAFIEARDVLDQLDHHSFQDGQHDKRKGRVDFDNSHNPGIYESKMTSYGSLLHASAT